MPDETIDDATDGEVREVPIDDWPPELQDPDVPRHIGFQYAYGDHSKYAQLDFV